MKKFLCMAAAAFLVACGGSSTGVESTTLAGSDEAVQFPEFQAEGKLSVTAPVNLRETASREGSLLMVVPADAEVTSLGASEQGYYKVSFGGFEGWAYGAYLRPVPAEFGQSTNALTLTEIDYVVNRTAPAMTYSYWWGGSKWGCGLGYGSCSGSCPSCTHYGEGGADCSGLVGQGWRVPPSSSASTCIAEHPYNTTIFREQRYHWTQVSRGDMRKVDSLVNYGHMFMRISGDGWGFMDVYECRGCSYGCRRRTRDATSDYIGIRRNTGWL
ncbi:MAG TPA: SH3 domain-containing protein [Myxococcus sp.]|nr:SH3 domain-containing protein [Myxococcus sp.]